MVMIKITTLENFSVSSQFARENLYYSYFYHHHHHCLLPKAMETGKFFSCVCMCINPLKWVRLLMLILKIEMHSTMFCGTLIFYGI